MMDPVRELKIRAEILGTRLSARDAASLARLRALPELRRADAAALAAMAEEAQRRHCLAVVALECGFTGWGNARRALEGDPGEATLGTLLYGTGEGDSGVLNHWFMAHDDARDFRDQAPSDRPYRYLLAYKRHFFVTARSFVKMLGMDPDDPDWRAIGYDWARPEDPLARGRLYYKRLAALRGAR